MFCKWCRESRAGSCCSVRKGKTEKFLPCLSSVIQSTIRKLLFFVPFLTVDLFFEDLSGWKKGYWLALGQEWVWETDLKVKFNWWVSVSLLGRAFLETLVYSKNTKCWQEPYIVLGCCSKLSPRLAGKRMFEPANDFGRASSQTIVAWLWNFAKYCTTNLRDGGSQGFPSSGCLPAFAVGFFRLTLCLSTIFLSPWKCMQYVSEGDAETSLIPVLLLFSFCYLISF